MNVKRLCNDWCVFSFPLKCQPFHMIKMRSLPLHNKGNPAAAVGQHQSRMRRRGQNLWGVVFLYMMKLSLTHFLLKLFLYIYLSLTAHLCLCARMPLSDFDRLSSNVGGNSQRFKDRVFLSAATLPYSTDAFEAAAFLRDLSSVMFRHLHCLRKVNSSQHNIWLQSSFLKAIWEFPSMLSSGVITQEARMYYAVCFSSSSRLGRNAACSFLPASVWRTTVNPDLTSLHRLQQFLLSLWWLHSCTCPYNVAVI